MHLKKKLIIAVGIILFIVLGAAAVFVSSRDNFLCLENGYSDINYDMEELQLLNWQENGRNEYVSGADPMILIEGMSCYVHSVKIAGAWQGEGDVQIFYTDEPGEDYSEAKSLSVPYYIIGGNVYLFPRVTAYSLRIDLTDESGQELRIKGAEINDRSPVVSFSRLMLWCLFPVMIYGAAAFAVLYMGNIRLYGGVFRKYVPLLRNLIDRDLKVKYRRSVLGFLWSILNPLLMALVITIVFSKIFRFQVEYFTVYYLTGSLIFNFVVEATTGSMTSVLGASGLIKKVYIPKYIFPLQKCLFAFINMLFSSIAVLVVIFIQGMPLKATALLFPVPMLYALVFSFGMGLILASVDVFFRDMEHLYSVFVSVWMYLTPIIYPEDILPGAVKSLMKINPMYHYVGYFRDVVMYGTVPGVTENIICAVFSLMFLGLGLVFFKKTQDRFVLYI